MLRTKENTKLCLDENYNLDLLLFLKLCVCLKDVL